MQSLSLPKKLLVAVDGSEGSLAAGRYAIELAIMVGAELFALHVVQIPEYVSADVRSRLEKELHSRGEAALSKVREAAGARNLTVHEKILTTTKSVVAAVCDAASKSSVELVVLGNNGAGGMAQLMLGSVAAGVVREAACPVLVVR